MARLVIAQRAYYGVLAHVTNLVWLEPSKVRYRSIVPNKAILCHSQQKTENDRTKPSLCLQILRSFENQNEELR